MSTPRKHHFVPQFYLGGFTPSGTRDDKLFVLDKTSGKQWRSSPGDAGAQRDFYLLDVDDEGDPLALENLFSTVEAGGADAIRFIVENQQVPEGELLRKLTDFLAIMYVRVPSMLDTLNQFTVGVIKDSIEALTASKERWDRFLAGMPDGGGPLREVTWEQMRDLVSGDKYEIAMSQNWKMATLGQQLMLASAIMMQRKWALWRVPSTGPALICSDVPVSLGWIDLAGKGPMPPALGAPGTALFFPLNKGLALCGRFDETPPAFGMDPSDVGMLNRLTASYAQRFIYSGEPDFVVTLHTDRVEGKKELLDALGTNGQADMRP